MSNSYLWPIDRILLGATTPGQSEPGSDDNEGVLRIPQSSSISGASPSDIFCGISRTLVREVLTPIQRCSPCILQFQQTESKDGTRLSKLILKIFYYCSDWPIGWGWRICRLHLFRGDGEAPVLELRGM